MESSKHPLPRNRSYPLKPSVLSQAVEASGLTTPVRLMRRDQRDQDLRATFYPDGSWRYADGDLS